MSTHPTTQGAAGVLTSTIQNPSSSAATYASEPATAMSLGVSPSITCPSTGTLAGSLRSATMNIDPLPKYA